MADNVYEALDNLRQEIQTDRIELQRTILSGFDKMQEKFEEHAKEDAEAFTDLGNRVQALEGTVTIAKRTLFGAVAAVFSSGVAWLFSSRS